MTGTAPAAGPVRVGFVIDALAPGAGTENQLLHLLGGLDPGRVTARLCCLRGPVETGTLRVAAEPLVLDVTRLRSRAGFRAWRSLRAWVRAERLEVVVSFFRDAGLLTALASPGLGIRHAASRRNIGRGYWHTPGELRLQRFLNRFVDAWLANGEAVRAYTVTAERVPPERVHVLPNALDTGRFRPPSAEERRQAREKLGLEGTDPAIFCVANLRPIKGLDVLMDAFSRVLRSVPEARLFLLGEGDERPGLEALAGRLDVADRVRFLGAREDVPSMLRAADLGVLASRGEGFPNALLEYAGMGLASVATDVGGAREILGREEAGILVPPGDPGAMAAALAALLEDDVRRNALGRRGREIASQRHALPVVLESWERTLAALAGRGVSGGA